MKPRLTVVSSHVRRLPERSPEYVAIHDELRREVAELRASDDLGEILADALILAFEEDPGFARRCMEGG